ncbi:hypothetical protein GN958_ATG11078 [Phytophthora infestans]|uniref:Uncharacterized protein n=1 Tax=Phytophthora infestans TaxID=4787 RepID=A0A8S9UGC8_PHYIN|nr:hypothetical protein GN958_ATG11078 [Phytophthora infestans]
MSELSELSDISPPELEGGEYEEEQTQEVGGNQNYKSVDEEQNVSVPEDCSIPERCENSDGKRNEERTDVAESESGSVAGTCGSSVAEQEFDDDEE